MIARPYDLPADHSSALTCLLAMRLADAEELLAETARMLDASFTTAGHLAQRVTQEHLGYCSWKGCKPECRKARLLLIAAAEHLAELRLLETRP